MCHPYKGGWLRSAAQPHAHIAMAAAAAVALIAGRAIQMWRALAFLAANDLVLNVDLVFLAKMFKRNMMTVSWKWRTGHGDVGDMAPNARACLHVEVLYDNSRKTMHDNAQVHVAPQKLVECMRRES